MNAAQLVEAQERKAEMYAALRDTCDLVQALMPGEQRAICRALVDLDVRVNRLDAAMPELDVAIVRALREMTISMCQLADNAGK